MAKHSFSAIGLGHTFARNRFADLQADKRNEPKKMTDNNTGVLRPFVPLLIIFVLAASFPLFLSKAFTRLQIDQAVALCGNLILFAVAITSLIFYRKALRAGNTQLFLRNFYSGMVLKFVVCLVAVLIYVLIAGNTVNRGGLFYVMGLYMIYTFTEIALVMKQSRQIKLNRNA